MRMLQDTSRMEYNGNSKISFKVSLEALFGFNAWKYDL